MELTQARRDTNAVLGLKLQDVFTTSKIKVGVRDSYKVRIED
jgi:hypothetical protein